MAFSVKKCMERDGFCRSVTSQLNCFLPRDTKCQKKSCVRLPWIPDWFAQMEFGLEVFLVKKR